MQNRCHASGQNRAPMLFRPLHIGAVGLNKEALPGVFSPHRLLLMPARRHIQRPRPTPIVMIELSHVSKAFAGKQVLKDVSATFNPGAVNMIIGKSGSGKSVLMKAMVGPSEHRRWRHLLRRARVYPPALWRQGGGAQRNRDAVPILGPVRLDDGGGKRALFRSTCSAI